MTDTEINVAIAEACGVKPFEDGWVVRSEVEKAICMSGTREECERWYSRLPANSEYRSGDWKPQPWLRWPNYCADLNAMHEAEKTMNRVVWGEYFDHLSEINEAAIDDFRNACHASARQRAEAFLRTVGKWKDPQ